jgi:preprotein translocase subunit YajC
MNLVLAAHVLLAATQKKQTNGIAAFLPLLVLVGVFYFLIMRPQQRRVKDQRSMTSNVKQGDRIVAAGGIVGTVRRIDDDTISLQVADNVVIKVDRGSVSKRLTEA